MQSEKAPVFGETKGFDNTSEQSDFSPLPLSGQQKERIFRLSLFNHKRDAKPRVVERTWQQICEMFEKPQIRLDKDGELFSPAFFDPAHRLKANVREVSLLVLDIDHKAELETLKTRLAVLDSAYVIYSTHSHLRRTEKNPNAEPRFRVCLPLASAIPANIFPALWQSVKHITELPFDENAKDESRMFYTPAIAEKDAAYVYFRNDGAFLDWKILLLDTLPTNDKTNAETQNEPRSLIFEFNEDRHAELCRRIEAQAKNTGRGGFEMKCPVHNGSGDTSLFYDPKTKAVSCRRDPKCSYFEILSAFGLPNGRLPSRERANENPQQSTDGKKPLTRLKTVRMSDVQTQEVKWLWQDYIPQSAFTILEGEEGLGKTWVLCAVGAATAQGYGLPNNSPGEPATVLMMSAEDSLSFVIKPRLEAVNAPCERIIAVDEHFTLDADGILRLEFELAEHAPKLVIIDPLFSYTGKINLNNDNEIRFITGELTRLAEKYECAIVGVRHIGKSKGMGDPRNAGLNGIGWRASARVVLLVGKDPNDERQRAIVQTKNNLAPKNEKAIGYEITDNEFFWKESDLTAQTMLSIPKNDEERGDQNEAVSFLLQSLQDGKRKAGELISEADKLGITKQRLRTARNKLGVESKSEGFGKDKQWFWELPKSVCVDVDTNNDQHLRINNGYKTSYASDLPLDVDISVKAHLSEDDQHLSNFQSINESKDSARCSNCDLEMNLIENGRTLFCPMGCESRKVK